MAPGRIFIGLAVGSGCEAVEAVAVRAHGFGLGMAPRPIGAARVPFPPPVRDAGRELVRRPGPWPDDLAAELRTNLAAATRHVAAQAGCDLREVMAAGLLARLPLTGPLATRPTASLADWLAEQTGLTVASGFDSRDVAAGGSGRLLTPAADFLLFRDPTEERLLIHLGSVATTVFLPASDRVSEVLGFECGPGNRLLDDLTALGTRGREPFDANGTRAVQGRCADDLLTRWLTDLYTRRYPTAPIPPSAYGHHFLTETFEAARSTGRTLHDLLCTATHFIARGIGLSCQKWLPPAAGVRRVLVSGGGARNGFLWKLVAEQFPGDRVERFDAVGVMPGARGAAAAAVLAALALDGVAASLPRVTGATGSRLLGHLTPGDQRNWTMCTSWMASRLLDYPAMGRVA